MRPFVILSVGVFNRNGIHGKIAGVGYAQTREGTHLQHRIVGTNDSRLIAHVARTHAGSGAIAGASIEWNAQQRDVQTIRVGNVGQSKEG